MRLNPFAFPATTDSWFVLLVVSLVGAITFVYNWLATFLPAYRAGVTNVALNCQTAARAAATELAAAASDPLRDQTAQLQASAGFLDCMAGFHLNVAISSLSGLPLLALAAGLVYWLIPRWIIRRRGLVELDPEDAADVLTGLADLSRDTDLKRAPTFLGAPGWTSTDALAFGRVGQRFVGLDQGLITLFYTHPERFRAVVLHELAHLRNGDVDKAYLVVSFSLAFAIVGLVPLLVSLVGQPWDLVLGLTGRALFLVALIAVTSMSVLRSRESYADVRASTWADARRGLTDLLQAAPTARLSRLTKLLQFHPAASERAAVLADTRILFRADLAEAVATGLALAILLPRLTSIVSSLFTSLHQPTIAPTVAAVVVAPLITGIVGLAIWRTVFASLAAGASPPACGRLALGLAFGLVLGQFLAFDAFVEVQFDVFEYTVLTLLWGGVVAVVLYGFLRWVAQGARSWLLAASTSPSPRPAYVSGLGLASLVLIVGFAALIELNNLTLAAMGGGKGGLIGALSAFGIGLVSGLYVLVSLPLTSLAIIGVWAYPLAARYWRPKPGAADGTFWAFLDPASPPALQAPGRSGLRLALIVGIGLGAVCCVVCLLLSLQYNALPPEIRNLADQKVQYYFLQVLACVVLETAGAAVVALRVPVLKAAHGLFSAFVTACIASTAIHILILMFGGSIDLQFLSTTLTAVVVFGGGAAMLAAGLAGALTRRVALPSPASVWSS